MNKTWILIFAVVFFLISLSVVEGARSRDPQRTGRNPFRRTTRQTTAKRTTTNKKTTGIRTTGHTTTFRRPTNNGPAPDGLFFSKILVIFMANANYNDVIKNPLMKVLGRRGKLLTNYHALGHPAQPNYIGAITGSTYNIRDNNPHQLNVTNIVDLLDAEGITWKVYAKNFPGPCFNGEFNGKTYVQSEYFRFTNPFMSMNNIRRNPFRCQHITDASEFKDDYAKDKLPHVAWYIPNAYESGLVVNLETSAEWLSSFLHNKINNLNDSAIFVTFDQSNPRFPDEDPAENNHVWAIAYGRAFSTIDTTLDYSHYSILSTIESNWGLPPIGNSTVPTNDQFAPPLSPMNPIIA